MPKNNTINVGLVQQHNTSSIEQNITRLLAHIEQLAKQGAELVVLQELHNSLYFCQSEDPANFDLAESIPGRSTERFAAIAKKSKVVIVTSLFEKRTAGIYHNTAVVLESDGTIAGTYRKMHIPEDPGYNEKFYFTPGDLGFHPIQTSLGKLGVLVCWDQWYPEAARLMAIRGADLLIYPTAIGFDPNDNTAEQERQRDAWITSQRAHAIANGLPVVSVNRVGLEPGPAAHGAGALFWGNSFVSGPQGEFLFQASTTAEESAVVSIDLNRSETVRRIWPFFRDRRIDAYGAITKRFEEK